ncbi:MAG: hypothetical protein RL607_2235 [Bacteroidota bacterium]|jgi:hypothetical protein
MFIGIISCKNDVSQKTIKIIAPLKNYTAFHTLDTLPKVIAKALENEATVNELKLIIENNKNPYVKAIAIDVLIHKDNEYAFELFEKYIDSKDRIIYKSDCLSGSNLLPTYIFNSLIFSEKQKGKIQKENYKDKFFKIVFNQKNLNANVVDEMYLWLPKSDAYYKIIRANILKNKSTKLLRALSIFKNKKDIDLIKSFGKDAFIGIALFNDDAFLEMFEKYISYNNNWEYKFALNQYPKSKTKMIYSKIENYNNAKK